MNVRAWLAAALIFTVAAFPAAAQDGRKHIVIARTPEQMAELPFSDAVLVGNVLYLSGYIGIDEHTGKPPGTIEEETRLAMDGMKQAVEAAGMSMDDVVKIDVLCTDFNAFKGFNSVYRTYFKKGFPARTFTGSTQLFMGAHLEITGVAVKSAK